MSIVKRVGVTLLGCVLLLLAVPGNSVLATGRVENPSGGAKGVKADVDPTYITSYSHSQMVAMLNISGGVNKYLNWGLEDNPFFGLVLYAYSTYADGSYDIIGPIDVPDNYNTHNLKIALDPNDSTLWRLYYDDNVVIVYNWYWPYYNSYCRARTQVFNNGGGYENGRFTNVHVFTSSRVWSLQTQSSWPNCYGVAASGYILSFSPQFYNWVHYYPY